MKIKEIVVKKDAKISMNYNTVSSSIILTAEVEEEDKDINLVHEKLSKLATNMLNKDIAKQIELIK